MRKLAIIFCLSVALPSALPAGVYTAALERVIGSLAKSIQELKILAAGVRKFPGAAKEEALRRGQAELSRLKPMFREAQLEAERLEQRSLIEKWRGRADRISDLEDVFKKTKELKELEAERAQLSDEFCGPRDLYRFAGDC
jgi:hypothetical protein